MDNATNITDNAESGADISFAPSDSTCENPRTVIRGLNSQDVDLEPKNEVGVHWLRASVKHSLFRRFSDWLCVYFGDYEDKDYGLWFFDRSLVWSNGVTLNYHSTVERAERLTDGKITVEISGTVLDTLSPLNLICFLRTFDNFKADIGRMDLYYDDSERIIRPMALVKLVHEADDDGNRTRRDYAGFWSIDPRSSYGKKGLDYDAVCFGKRGSFGCGKYLRIYDKAIESKGKNPSIRWELELSGEKAKKAYAMFLEFGNNVDIFAKTITAIIAGSINFVHRTGEKNINRLEQYGFWKTLLSRMAEAVPLRGERKENSIEKKQYYLDDQMGASLITVKLAIGNEKFFEWLLNVLDDEGRLKKHHKKLIEDYKTRLEDQPEFNIKDFQEFCNERNVVIGNECIGKQETLFEDKEFIDF